MWKNALVSQQLILWVGVWRFWNCRIILLGWNCNLKLGRQSFFFNSDFNALGPKSVTDKQKTDRQKADVWYDTVWDQVMIRVQHYYNIIYCCAVKSGVDQINQKMFRKCRKQRKIPKCWSGWNIRILVKWKGASKHTTGSMV